MKNPKNQKLQKFARENRKEGTKGEAIMWSELFRAKKMCGYQFNRQFIIDNYIVDFICRKLKLIIEIDGQSHNTNGVYDFNRQKYLESKGYQVIRFSEGDVVYRLKNVALEIQNAIEQIEKK